MLKLEPILKLFVVAVALINCDDPNVRPTPKVPNQHSMVVTPVSVGNGYQGDNTGVFTSQEVCDGRDNDGNNLIDDGIPVGECTTSEGQQGVHLCLGGSMVCVDCEPQTTREKICTCGPSKTQRCGADGYWQPVFCDGCADTLTRPAECVPGTSQVRRCDTCTDATCIATCFGARWQCDANGFWQQVSACEVYPSPTCAADEVYTQACGRCGSQTVRCDGCFWDYGPCDGHGDCAPGQRAVTACEQMKCAENHVAKWFCDNTCNWQQQGSCLGCEQGFVDTTTSCVPGFPKCGSRVTRTTCSPMSIQTCDASLTLNQGVVSTEVIVNECQSNQCTPGRQWNQGCTTPSGCSGTQNRICTDSCTWGNFSTCSQSTTCTPGSSTTSQPYNCSWFCSQTYTQTKTCNPLGCGYVTTSSADVDCATCPVCNQVCTPGTTRIVPRRCSYCSVSYSRTDTCQPDGCSWRTTGTDEATVCEACKICTPGATQQIPCQTVCGGGVQQQTCDWSGTAWNNQGICQPNVVPVCTPGQQESSQCLFCAPGKMSHRTCMDTCLWDTWTVCPPCG